MENNGACCWAETNVVKRAATALEKMKEMFVLALSNLEDPSCEPTKVASGNVTDSDRHHEACTFRGNPVASNVSAEYGSQKTIVVNNYFIQ